MEFSLVCVLALLQCLRYYRRYGVSLGQKSEVKLKKMMEVRYKTAVKGQSKTKSSKKADSAKKVEVKKSAEKTDKKLIKYKSCRQERRENKENQGTL